VLPDMREVLTEWEQPVKLKTVSVTTIDFIETQIVTVENKRAVLQVADKEKLNIDSLNWSKSYRLIHSKFPIDIDQYIEANGKDYKIVGLEDYSEYGYFAAVGEETKKALLVAS